MGARARFDTATSYVQTCLGPRLPGGVYVNGSAQRTHEVVAVYCGDDARAELGGAPVDWVIAVIDLEGGELDGQVRMDRTAWDSARDYVIFDPAR